MLKLFKKEVKPKSIFMGRKVRKYWSIDERYSKYVELDERTETLERVKVLEKEMCFEFNIDEEIYLEELGKYSKVEKKTKDTDGNIIYNITYVSETVEDYDENIKVKYEELLEEFNINKEKNNQEADRIKAENQLKKQNKEEEYKKFCEKKELIPKKGIIIHKIPMGKDGRNNFLIDLQTVEHFHEVINERFPEYDVVTTPMNVEIFNYDINGKLVGMNDKDILFKN